jgi:hypothetical protein
MADKKEDISEDELDQIIQDMSKEDEVVVPIKPTASSAQGKNVSVSSASSPQSLTLEMNGAINLKLSFKSGERSIEVSCTEEALICRMADGSEFRIPVGDGKARKAA